MAVYRDCQEQRPACCLSSLRPVIKASSIGRGETLFRLETFKGRLEKTKHCEHKHTMRQTNSVNNSNFAPGAPLSHWVSLLFSFFFFLSSMKLSPSRSLLYNYSRRSNPSTTVEFLRETENPSRISRLCYTHRGDSAPTRSFASWPRLFAFTSLMSWRRSHSRWATQKADTMPARSMCSNRARRSARDWKLP